jgi:hypothetical protein
MMMDRRREERVDGQWRKVVLCDVRKMNVTSCQKYPYFTQLNLTVTDKGNKRIS